MPRVKIDYIVSFSSEDPENPASNLLSWDVNKKKWLCSKGESSCSIVLQLTKAVKISSVNIGAYQSALVEVLVGRSAAPNEPFQVLVPTSVFQTPAEARRGDDASADKVRSFHGEALAAARDQRWDRLRLVCSQPYDKHCKFGLSFIHVYTEEAVVSAPSPAPAPAVPARLTAALDLHSSDEEEFRPGELFAKHQQAPKEPLNTLADIRQSTSRALRNIPDPSMKLTKTPIIKPSCSKRDSGADVTDNVGKLPDRQRDSLLYTADDDLPHSKIDRVVNKYNEQKKDETRQKDKKEDTPRHVNTNKTKTNDESSNKGDGQSKIGIAGPSRRKDDSNDRKKDDSNDRRKDGSYDRRKDDSNDRKKDDSNDRRKDGSYDRRKDDSNDRKKDDSNDRRKDDSNDRRKDDSHDRRKVELTGRKNNDVNTRDDGAGRRGDDNRKRPRPDKDHNANKTSSSLAAGPVSSAPHTLLSDVVFVLSGYENPRRSTLRTAALALGARCERDWGPRATHLICAFPNTPKLRAVRAASNGGRAVVVLGEWIEECARTRRRLPWQWFATEPKLLVPAPPDWDTGEQPPSECDTDDEIEKVRQKMKKRRDVPPPPASTSPPPARDSPPPARVSPSPERQANVSGASTSSDVKFVRDERLQGIVTLSDSDSCGGDTDVELAGDSPRSAEPRGRLPPLFAGRSFAVRAGDEGRARVMERYLRGYGGVVLQDPDSEVDFVVCESASDVPAGSGTPVRAAWLWRCHGERRLVSPERYSLAT